MLYFILIATVLVTNAFGVEKCPVGWTQFEQTCYRKWGDIADFNTAKETCQKENALLVKITSSAQNEFVTKLYTSNYNWIGVSDPDKDGVFTYADGSPLKYTNWRKGEPDNNKGIEQCVLMYTNHYRAKWNDVRCELPLPFICTMEIKTPVAKPVEKTCPEGYSHYTPDNMCYKTYSLSKNFPEAVKACKAENADLAQIKNKGQEKFVLRLRSLPYIWIGFAKSKSDNKFRYIDGTEFGAYHPWSIHEPNNYGGNEECGLMYGSGSRSGRWNDASCLGKHPYICSTRLGIASCPEGWSHYPADNTCIKSFSTRKSFANARKTCKSEGNGDLVQIKNEAQKDFILGLGGLSVSWIGVVDNNNDEHYRYVDGSELGAYRPWNSGEPNNYGGREHCAMMYGSGHRAGKWNDAGCGYSLAFICSAENK